MSAFDESYCCVGILTDIYAGYFGREIIPKGSNAETDLERIHRLKDQNWNCDIH